MMVQYEWAYDDQNWVEIRCTCLSRSKNDLCTDLFENVDAKVPCGTILKGLQATSNTLYIKEVFQAFMYDYEIGTCLGSFGNMISYFLCPLCASISNSWATLLYLPQ